MGKRGGAGGHPLQLGRLAVLRLAFEFSERARQCREGALPIVREHTGQRLCQRLGAGIAAGHFAQQSRLQGDLGDPVDGLSARRRVERQLLCRQEAAEISQGLDDLLELHDAGGIFEGVQRVDEIAAHGLVGFEGAGQLGQPALQ